jgi:hypothetical protein
MDIRKFILRHTLILTVGELVCVGAMVGIYALLGQLNWTVPVGGVIGLLLAVGNFFFMALSASSAADKAQNQDVKGGKATVKSSFLFRLLVMFALLFVFAKAGVADPIAMVVPLFLVRPIISVVAFFEKPGKEQL